MPAGREQPTGPGKLGPVTIGITGAVGTSGAGIIVARLASGGVPDHLVNPQVLAHRAAAS